MRSVDSRPKIVITCFCIEGKMQHDSSGEKVILVENDIYRIRVDLSDISLYFL
jgi:hypothetical protein